MPVIAFATKIDGDPNNITVDWSLYNQVIPLLDIQKASIVFLLKTLQSTHFLLLGFFNRERYPTSIFIIIVQFSGRNYINRFRTVTTPSKAKNIKQVFIGRFNRLEFIYLSYFSMSFISSKKPILLRHLHSTAIISPTS